MFVALCYGNNRKLIQGFSPEEAQFDSVFNWRDDQSPWSFSIPSCISLATFGSSNESHFINTNNDSCSPVMMIINPKKRSKI